MKNKILVIGSANTDLVIHSPKMPTLGETLTGSDFQINAGGKGLNQAVAIAKLGGEVSFFGAVGEDANGKILMDCLKEYQVNFEGITLPNTPTGTAMITVVKGDNFILLHPGANHCLTPGIIEQKESLIAQSEFCVLQLEIPMDSVCKVCELAKKHNTKVVLNPAPFTKLPQSLFSKIDYFIPNEHEAFSLTGTFPDTRKHCIQAVEQIKTLGIPHPIITLGEKGCVYHNGTQVVFHPAVPTKAVDTTAAGDTFIGALVTKLSQNKSLEEAITFATKAAAITVSREGAAKSIPFTKEIE